MRKSYGSCSTVISARYGKVCDALDRERTGYFVTEDGRITQTVPHATMEAANRAAESIAQIRTAVYQPGTESEPLRVLRAVVSQGEPIIAEETK